MKKKLLLIIALAFLAILLVFGPVSAKAIVTRWESIELVDDVFPEVCQGIEDIHVQGTIVTKYRTVLDGNGGFHFSSHYNCQDLSGTGLTSGDTYVVNCTFSHTQHGSVGETNTLIYTMNLVSKGSGDNIQLKGVNHYTVNANGEVTVDKATFRAVCK